jgi:hypothetical protein
MELYSHSPNTPSLRGAQLMHRDNFTFTFPIGYEAYVHIFTRAPSSHVAVLVLETKYYIHKCYVFYLDRLL